MTPTERERYVELHHGLDCLLAAFMQAHPHERGVLDMPIRKLVEWSHKQTLPADARAWPFPTRTQ